MHKNICQGLEIQCLTTGWMTWSASAKAIAGKRKLNRNFWEAASPKEDLPGTVDRIVQVLMKLLMYSFIHNHLFLVVKIGSSCIFVKCIHSLSWLDSVL